MITDFSLFLFSTDAAFIRSAAAAGVDGIVVDWEWRGKHTRQNGADTEINRDTADDLRRVREATDGWVICRVNGYDPAITPGEVEQAIEAGANEILLPMVRSQQEVRRVLDLCGLRAEVGILIETVSAAENAASFAELPLSRIYVGLNDLNIERRTPNLFTPLVDGTLDRVCGAARLPRGFGGLTLPDRGSPIPCRLLIGEMMRLNCSFSFLRRSFKADVGEQDLRWAVPRIREAIVRSAARSPAEIVRERAELVAAVESWTLGPEFEKRL
ncbi:MAG: aldolase/citrate lyase family protein [Bryobacteraceae bacterium]